MDSGLAVDAAVLVGSLLLVIGAALSGAADRFRTPGLLLFLVLGMVVGDDGLGLISFDDPGLAQTLGVVALIVILFEGGLSTSLDEARPVAAPALLLATVGVLVTAAVVAGAVMVFADVGTTTALLIGAVVASTDAAAVFAVLRKAPVPRRLALMLETESGANDPMAVLLTVGILASWEGDPTTADWIAFGLRQLVGGVVIGIAVGWLAAAVLRRLSTDDNVLAPVLALGGAGLAYGLGTLVGASGFLAVYLAGLMVATAAPSKRRVVARFHEAMAAMAQIGLFLMLGLLVFPSQLPGVLGIGVVIAAALILVARPLAIALCLPWFGLGVRSNVFVAWAGLRGAVPIVLATFPLTAGYPEGDTVFNAVFFVVLASATVQGLTIGPVAGKLGLSGERDVLSSDSDL
ncbi:MAG: potassium/proton antiporter [Actinomycetia bacterium]|nr:potassium/proton antiporter [Actinomycetes bacterium]